MTSSADLQAAEPSRKPRLSQPPQAPPQAALHNHVKASAACQLVILAPPSSDATLLEPEEEDRSLKQEHPPMQVVALHL